MNNTQILEDLIEEHKYQLIKCGNRKIQARLGLWYFDEETKETAMMFVSDIVDFNFGNLQ